VPHEDRAKPLGLVADREGVDGAGWRACVRACAMSSQVLPAVEALDLRLGGRRVGVRVFASHDSAALALARAVGPLTATSANVCE
jgi:hypothetical protein